MPSKGSGFNLHPEDLHGSGSQLGSFGDQLTQGGQKLQSVGDNLVSHASRDKSGVGSVLSKALGTGVSTAGKVFSEGGRVTSAAGKRMHANADSHSANEAHTESVFKGINAKGDTSAKPHAESGPAPKSDPNGGGSGDGGHHDYAGPTSKQPASPSRPNDPKDTSTPPDLRPCKSDPVDVATGAVVMTEQDLELAGPWPLVLRRTHISDQRTGRLFGSSWSATVDQRLELDDEGVCLITDDGMVLVYPHPEPGTPVLPAAGPRWPLTVGPDGRYAVTAGSRTLRFGTRTGPRREVVELDAITGERDERVDVLRDDVGLPAELRHSDGYRVVLRTEQGRITELHVTGANAETDVLVLRYRYDERGRLVEQLDSSGLPATYEYDEPGRLTGWQDRDGTHYRYVYDEQGRCVRTLGVDGYFSGSFAYEPDARRTSYTDSLGRTTVHVFDEAHRTVLETDPLGAVTAFAWDAEGRLAGRTDPLGRVTRFEYRPDGTVATVIRADGSRVAVTGRAGRSLRIRVEDGGRVWRRDYDGPDRPDPLTTPLGVSITPTAFGAALGAGAPEPDGQPGGAPGESNGPERDVFGRPVLTTGADGRTTRLGWTVAGNLAWRATPGTREQWRYDPEGNEVERIDVLGQPTRHEYGPFHLRTATVDATGARTTFGYDTELRLVAVTNPHGQTWRYGYDPAGRISEVVDFDGRRLSYAYDAAGQLVRSVNAAGQAVEYGYDVLGNLVELRTDAGRSGFGYDPVGMLVAASSPGAELNMSRDEHGRLLEQTVNGRTLTFGYDSRRISRRTPSGVDSEWTFDPAGRPAGLTVDGHAMAFGYDSAGRESTRQVDQTVLISTTVDPERRSSTQTVTVAGEADAGNAWYQRHDYRADDHVIGIEDAVTGYTSFELDAHGRIAEVVAAGHTEHYRYDALGNLALAGTGADARVPLEYEGNTLVRTADAILRYDLQGRTVQRLQGGRDWRYEWDALDRMTGVTTPDGTRWRYHYDPLGRRIAKQRLDSAGAVAEQVEFVWDGGNLVEQVHTDPAGVRVTTWEHRPGDDRPLTQIEGGGGIRRFYTIVTDPLGTPVELFDGNGSRAHHPRTTVWGAELPGAPAGAITPLRFPGQYLDAETGLHYNVCRYYDPATARYLSPDPLGLAPAANPLTYVANPLQAKDPLGLMNSCTTGSTNTSSAPANPAAPAGPHLIPSNGKGPNAVSDDKFNDDHEIDHPPLDDAADDVRNDPSNKKKSEALGEEGAVAYLQGHTGHDDIELHHASPEDPHTLPATQGQRWSHAVAFNGAHVADVSYWDGHQMHVVEAKGGGSTLGDRQQTHFHEQTNGQDVMADSKPAWQNNSGAHANLSSALRDQNGWKTFAPGAKIPPAVKTYNPTTLDQGTHSYLTDIGHTMSGSTKGDGRDIVGQAILDPANNVHYQPVSTQALPGGGVDVHTMNADDGDPMDLDD